MLKRRKTDPKIQNGEITNFPQLDMIKCSRFDCDFVVLHHIDRPNGTMIWYGLSSNGIIFPEHAFYIMPICRPVYVIVIPVI